MTSKEFEYVVKTAAQFKKSLLILSLIQLPLALATIWTAFLIKSIIDSITAKNAAQGAVGYVTIFILLIITQSLVQLFSTKYGLKLKTDLANGIQLKLMAHIQKLEFKHLQQQHGGKLLTLLTSDVENISATISDQLPKLVKSVVICVGASIAISLIYPPFLLLLILFIPVAFLYNKLYGRKMKKIHIDVQEKENHFRTYVLDILGNLAVIKAFGNYEIWLQRLSEKQSIRTEASINKAMLSNVVTTIMSIGGYLVFVFILFFGAEMVRSGAITFGILISFIQLVSYSTNSIRGIAAVSGGFASCLGSALRLLTIIDLANEPEGQMPNITGGVGVRFQDVTFGYHGGNGDSIEGNVLTDTNLEIFPYETVGIVGVSGVGKSTIANLIMSFYKPQSGQVLFTLEHAASESGDSSAVTAFEACQKARRIISYVPQGNTLMTGTIKENVLVGAPNASSIEIRKAIELAGMEEIYEWTEGVDTVLGEKGTRLSAGQAQRICLARAFIRDANVLILDEATSSLDVETEMKIISRINDHMKDRTKIIITHRMEALQYCDKILLVSENGQIKSATYEMIN